MPSCSNWCSCFQSLYSAQSPSTSSSSAGNHNNLDNNSFEDDQQQIHSSLDETKVDHRSKQQKNDSASKNSSSPPAKNIIVGIAGDRFKNDDEHDPRRQTQTVRGEEETSLNDVTLNYCPSKNDNNSISTSPPSTTLSSAKTKAPSVKSSKPSIKGGKKRTNSIHAAERQSSISYSAAHSAASNPKIKSSSNQRNVLRNGTNLGSNGVQNTNKSGHAEDGANNIINNGQSHTNRVKNLSAKTAESHRKQSNREREESLFLQARTFALTQDKESLKRLVFENRFLIDRADAFGRTLLMYACFTDSHFVVKWLLNKGAQIDTCDRQSRSALHWATQKGATNCLKALLEFASSAASPYPKTAEDLSGIRRRRRKSEVESACLVGDDHGVSPLHFAARLPSSKCLQIILSFLDPIKGMRLLSSASSRTTDSGISSNRVLVSNVVDCHRRSPLHYAAAGGQPDNLLLLLRHQRLGLSLDAVDDDGRNPLMWAVLSKTPGGLECVRILLDLTPWTAKTQDLVHGLSALHLAVISENLECIELLLSGGRLSPSELQQVSENERRKQERRARHRLRPDVLDNQFRTPLHWAAKLGFTQIVSRLLVGGCRPNLRDQSGATPLHYAAQSNYKETLRALLHKANHDLCLDSGGRTAFMWAVSAGSRETVVEILKIMPKLNRTSRDEMGGTALHLACHSGQINIVELLISRGWDVNAEDKNGMTPLLISSERGHSTIVKILLKAKCSYYHADSDGRTAIHWAALGGHAFICQLLQKEYGVGADCVDGGGRSPLHCAAFGGFMGCLTILLQGGGNPDLADNAGYTPLHMAASEGHTDAIHLLLHWNATVNAIATTHNYELVTALNLALYGDHGPVIESLIGSGGLTYAQVINLAALKIQTVFRGYSVRQRCSFLSMTGGTSPAICQSNHQNPDKRNSSAVFLHHEKHASNPDLAKQQQDISMHVYRL